jgi:hypothetical protein
VVIAKQELGVIKDAYEVLDHKEADIARARREIESLTIVASILAEDTSDFFNPDGLNRKPAEKELSPMDTERY